MSPPPRCRAWAKSGPHVPRGTCSLVYFVRDICLFQPLVLSYSSQNGCLIPSVPSDQHTWSPRQLNHVSYAAGGHPEDPPSIELRAGPGQSEAPPPPRPWNVLYPPDHGGAVPRSQTSDSGWCGGHLGGGCDGTRFRPLCTLLRFGEQGRDLFVLPWRSPAS